MGDLQVKHCSSVRMGLINDVLTTLNKVLNIEEAVRPVGPRDILLSGKRNAWAGEYGSYRLQYHGYNFLV